MVFDRIIRMLLDELRDKEDLAERVEALEAWKQQVESAWPQITEDE